MVKLTILLLGFSVFSPAQNVVSHHVNGSANDCFNLVENKQFPGNAPVGRLRTERDPVDLAKGDSTRSSFELSRQTGEQAKTLLFDVCFGDLVVTTNPVADKLHSSITLGRELPPGVTAGSFIQGLESKGMAELFVKIPKRYLPCIRLAIPKNLSGVDVALAQGNMRLTSYQGVETSIQIAKGRLALDADQANCFGLLQATIALGRLTQDGKGPQWNRSGPTWSAVGLNPASPRLKVSIASGTMLVGRNAAR